MEKYKKNLVKFIKEYPRVFSVGIVILVLIFLLIPIPLGSKIAFILRALVLGFLLALIGLYFLRKNESKE